MDPGRLKKIPVFANLTDEELGHIAALAAEVSVPESKELVREGDYSYDVLAIEECTARVERSGAITAHREYPTPIDSEEALLESEFGER